MRAGRNPDERIKAQKEIEKFTKEAVMDKNQGPSALKRNQIYRLSTHQLLYKVLSRN